MIGFTSTADPEAGPYTLNGFWVADPWYGGTNTTHTEPDGGTIGLQPDTFITVSAWNSGYMLPYQDSKYENLHGNTIWHGAYTVVLRTVNGTQEPTKTYDTMPQKFSDTFGGAAAIDPGLPADPGYGLDYQAAVQGGIQSNLLDVEGPLAGKLWHVTAGRHVSVTSMSADIGNFDLVEVRNEGKTVAIAWLTHGIGGLHFAGLQTLYAGNALPDGAAAAGALHASGHAANGLHLAWEASSASFEPFSPFWVGTDGDGSSQVLTPEGQVVALASLNLGK
ncbi:MAG TPA: hypothetical protein VGI98_06190 [Candidatus Limnocylindrales bacterium]